MRIRELFSRRRKRSEQAVADVLVHDVLPEGLRCQVGLLWREVIGDVRIDMAGQGHGRDFDRWHRIYRALCRERGRFLLHAEHQGHPEMQVMGYFLEEPAVDLAIDVIELVFDEISLSYRDGSRSHAYRRAVPTMSWVEVVAELNSRFRQHSVGYEYADGQVIRVDSSLVHAEAVRPALKLLHHRQFGSADKAFRMAFEHYRHDRHSAAIVEATKAFESTLRVICESKGWDFDPKKGIKGMVKAVMHGGLLHSFQAPLLGNVRGLLEGALPPVRNALAAHGSGSVSIRVDSHYARFALNSCAATIVLLVDAYESSRRP